MVFHKGSQEEEEDHLEIVREQMLTSKGGFGDGSQTFRLGIENLVSSLGAIIGIGDIITSNPGISSLTS